VPKQQPAAVVQPDGSGAEVSDSLEAVRFKSVDEDAGVLGGGVDPAAELATVGRPGEGPENVGMAGRVRHALRRLLDR
ncbi:MAG: hypothetical protein M3458_09375, partial [Acidobacteriota bacterium]|nr:hypothetical protein [Acidobacteriota bacterium]